MDTCLDLLGSITLSDTTKQEMLGSAGAGGELRFGSEDEARSAADRIRQMLQLIVATKEYQLC